MQKVKLQKNSRESEKSLTFFLKKPIEIANESNKVEEKENYLSELIEIESEFLGSTDLLIKSSFLDPYIDITKFKYKWTISHFNSDSQYLNGRKEIDLRIK